METKSNRIEKLILSVKEAATQLNEKGYAIIPDVFSQEECAEIREKMWQHISDISGGELTPTTDYTKLKADQLPAHKHGIIESWRFNHFRTIREIRRHERILLIYALLYGTDQLTSSIDRVNFKFPGRVYQSNDTWPHVDQNPAKLGCITIQSYVTFLDCHEDSPGNRFYEGSHKIFEEFFKEKRGLDTSDWNKLTPEERVALPKQCPLVKPVYRAGSMLLWDSRTVHDPDDGSNFNDGRFVVYVCYNRPWEKAEDAKFWEKKKQAFLDCRATSHAPIPQSMFGKTPWNRGKPAGRYDEIPKEKLGMENPDTPIGAEQYLFGFKSYNKKEGLLLGDPQWRTKYGVRAPLLDFVSPFVALAKGKTEEKKRKSSASVVCTPNKRCKKTQ